METYNIVVVDDHALMRESIKSLIAARADLKVIGEAEDGSELVSLLESGKAMPHMIVLDITMPRMDGFEAARMVRKHWPDIKILMLTIHKESEFVDKAIAAGADGYILKEGAAEEIFTAIETIRGGGVYLGPFYTDKMLSRSVGIGGSTHMKKGGYTD